MTRSALRVEMRSEEVEIEVIGEARKVVLLIGTSVRN